MNRSLILTLGMASSLVAGTSNVFAKKTEKKPNFIIIMADDLGYNGIECFGNKTIKTPFLDKMAREGIRFTDFHSNGPVCSPTRAALLTGKYQQRTGIEGVVTAANHRDVGLAIEEQTFADALKEQGYVTGMFGKWHVGYPKEYNPVLQGFDEFKGFVSGNVDYHAHIDQEGYFDWWEGQTLKDDKGYSTDLITKYGVDFLKRHKDESFLLYLPHEAPHSPLQRRVDKALRKVGVAKTAAVKKEEIHSIYKEMVEVMDEGIGKIIQTLEELDLDENTLVLFCSDNGGAKYGHNDPLRGHKGTLYEGGHRVPAIAWWPGKIKPGTTTDETVMTMDLFPTMLDIAGVSSTPKNFDGVSFKKLLLKESPLKKRDLFWRYKNRSVIRQGKWKLIVTRSKTKSKVELFNLDNDISEKNNLANNYPEMVKKMRQKLNKWEHEVSVGHTPLSK